MSITTIKGFEIGPVLVLNANSTVNVKAGATLMTSDGLGMGGPSAAIMENIGNPASNHNNVYNLDGKIIGGEVGVYTVGANDKINIGATGEVYGQYGVVTAGKNAQVTNNGQIIATVLSTEGAGIFGYEADGARINNNGFVSGAVGIQYTGDNGIITNGKNGLVMGSTYGMAAGSDAGDSVTFINHGRVIGSSGIAFTADTLDATLINDGTMKGSIMFGDGNDTFDNRGGVLSAGATIAGGLGDDVLIVDNAKYKLTENAMEGHDTVRSTVTYTLSKNVEALTLLGKANINGTGSTGDETLRGNTGNNVLKGLGGADDLFGGKGNDKLTGGAGNDEFHFAKGDGHDTIQDFHQMEDTIDVSHWTGINNFTQLMNKAHDQGANVMIENGADSLLIIGFHKADLTDGDFAFPH